MRGSANRMVPRTAGSVQRLLVWLVVGALVVLPTGPPVVHADEVGGTEVIVPPPAPPPASPPPSRKPGKKWGPHFDMGFKGSGELQLGRGSFVIPLWQNDHSMLFTDLRMLGDDKNNIEGNAGLAYRWMGESWIFGGYGFFDARSSDLTGNRNTFVGGTLGLETMSETFDFRVNGYIPEDKEVDFPSMARVVASGSRLVIEKGIERALYGVDGEVGVRIWPFGGEDSMFWDTRLFAGGFHFDASGVDNLSGPKGRFEARLHDVPLLPRGSRLTLGAEIRYDDVRETDALGSIFLRIPFYGWFGGGQGSAADGGFTKLERRMVDPIVRDVDIQTLGGQSGTEDAVNPKTGKAIRALRFAAAGASGSGNSTGNPDNLAGAVASADENGVVVVLASGGDYSENVDLFDGQYVVGEGGKIPVTGKESGLLYWRAPGSTRPTLLGGNDNDADDIIDLAQDNYIGNIAFMVAPFQTFNFHAIRGNDVGDAMVAYSYFGGFRSPSEEAIHIDGSSKDQRLTVMDSWFVDNDTGIELSDNARGYIVDNWFLNNGAGVRTNVDDSDDVVRVDIAWNLFQDNDEGVTLEFDDGGFTQARIYHNRFTGNAQGLDLDADIDGDEDSAILRLDVVSNYFLMNNVGVEFELDDDRDTDNDTELNFTTNVRGNHFYENDVGMFIDIDVDSDSSGNHLTTWTGAVSGNWFMENNSKGVDFTVEGDSDDSDGLDYRLDWEFSNNEFKGNGNEGFKFNWSSWSNDGGMAEVNLGFTGNRFLKNRDGLEFDVGDVDSFDGTYTFNTWIRDNTFAFNSDDAIEFDVSDGWNKDIDIYRNHIKGGSTGIEGFLSDSEDFSTLRIGRNTIHGANVGIRLDVEDTEVSSGPQGNNLVSGGTETDFSGSSGNDGTIRVNGVDLKVEF